MTASGLSLNRNGMAETSTGVLAAQVARLEAENERIFREAQLAADMMFTDYQLSQILASHETPAALAPAILDELSHVCGAGGGALWLFHPRSGRPLLAAQRGRLPDGFDPQAAPGGTDRWQSGATSWVTVTLDDGARRAGVVALSSPIERPLAASGLRFLALVRHQLAVAIRGAQLRQSLETERSELSAIIEGASDAILLVDEHRRLVRLNAAAGRLLGDAPEAAIGLTCREVLACDRTADGSRPCAAGCAFERVLASGEPLTGLERTLSGARAEAVHVVGNYALASRSAGGLALVVAIFRDTTQLAQLEELRRGFVATVSHELRTPLALAKGYVDTLLHLDPDPAAAREYVERIDRTLERLGRLVSQILDVTQLAAGQLLLERTLAEPGQIVAAAVEDLRLRRPDLRITIAATQQALMIEADSARLRQVIDNLLDNAAKYGPQGGRVRIRLDRTSGEVVIRIDDAGIGIPADERELVFEQFHRARNVRESHLPGYGLGLAISRRIIEAHGGSLTIDRRRRRGTEVVMRLPSARVALQVGS